MNDLDIVFKVPCGYAEPGELPPPLPGGADGGIILPPSPPDTGPRPIDPSGPITPPPDEPVIRSVVPTVDVGPISDTTVTVTVNTNFTTYTKTFQVFNSQNNLVFSYENLNSLVFSRPIRITGLTAGQTYSFYGEFTKPPFGTLVTYSTGIIQGTFTTSQGAPPLDLEIVNAQASFEIVDNSPILNVSFNTVNINNNNSPLFTTSRVGIKNSQGVDLTSKSLLNTTNHVYQFTNEQDIFLPNEQYQIFISTTLPNTNQQDSEVLSRTCPPYSNTPPLIPEIVMLNTAFSFPNSVPTLDVDFQTIIQNSFTILPTNAQVTLTGGGNTQVYNSPAPDNLHILSFSNLSINTYYTLTIIVTSQTGNTDTDIITNIIYDDSAPVDQLNSNNSRNGRQFYDRILEASYYSDSEYDLKYTKYKISPSQFLPTYSDLKTDIFGKIKHYSLDRLLRRPFESFEEAVLDSTNLSDDHIKNSLNTSVRKLYDLKFNNGVPLDQTKVSNIFRRNLELGTINNLDSGYFNELTKTVTSTGPKRKRLTSVKKSGYGVPIQDLNDSRTISNTPITNDTSIVRNPEYGTSLIPQKMISITPSSYNDDSKNLLNLWYVLPTDINKRAYFYTSAGLQDFYVQNTDAIQAYDASGNSVLLSVTINDTLECYLTSSEEINIPLDSDIHKANVLKNEDEHLVLYHLGYDKQILLTASCPDPNVEFTSSLNPPKDHYVLKLNTSTIEESPDVYSPFVIDTNASYTIVTSSLQDIQSFNEDIIYRAYPWVMLMINHNDPIWDYFDYTNSSVSGTSFNFTFRDVTYTNFGFNDDVIEPFLVRKIPRFIVVMPTNRTLYDFYSGNSVLTGWNTRQLRWEMSPDKRLYETGLTTHPFEVKNSFIVSEGESKSGEFSTQAYICTYGDTTNYQKSYKDPENIPDREVDSFRAALQKVNEIKENYELDSGITWYDLYSRLDRKHLYNIDKIATGNMINRLRKGEKTDVKIFQVKGPKKGNPDSRKSPTRLSGQKTDIELTILYATQVPTVPPIDELPFGEGGV